MEKILYYLKEEPAIALIGFVGVILAALIQKNRDLTFRNAKRALKSRIRADYKDTGREPEFFETGTSKKAYRSYRKNVIIEKVPLWDFGLQKMKNRPNWKESAVIKGEAGIGKTIFLENLFLRYNTPLRRWAGGLFLSRYCVKTTFRELTTDLTFQEMLTNVKCRRLSLLVDGFDEVSDNDKIIQHNITELLTFLRHLNHCRKKNILLFGRTAFMDKYLQPHTEFCSVFHACYELKEWTEEMASVYEEKLLNQYLKGDRTEKKEQIKSLLRSKAIRECIGHNPLRHKMMLYICLYYEEGEHGYEGLVELKEQFHFYSRFLEIIVKREWNRMFDFPAEEEEIRMILNAHAQIAFYIFQKKPINKAKLTLPQRIANFKDIRTLLKNQPIFNVLLKCTTSEEKEIFSYIHKTFEEYLVARYLHWCLRSAKEEEGCMILLADSLMQSYSNDYADFITSGFRMLSPKSVQDAFFLLAKVYDHTIQASALEISEKSQDRDLLKYVQGLSDCNLLHLKYEIVFLAGRLGQGKLVQTFLRQVYQKDDLTEYGDRRYQKYQNVILKRCCAISASLIGDEKTELDYIKRMIPDTESYDREYDLVNRSHTLIYYHDVSSTEIIDFQDEDPSVPWTNARTRRIRRLRVKPKGSDDKYTYFRAFDLATIYAFLKNRSQSASQLNIEEIKILRNCEVDIPGVSTEKVVLMKELKE